MSGYEHHSIKTWALEDRPREKLMQRGISSLTDSEILALILGQGTKNKSAISLAKDIIKKMGGLQQLARTSVKELLKINGIGPAKAISIVASFELGRRKHLSEKKEIKITKSKTVAQYLIPTMSDLEVEVFYILFLNRNNVIKGEKMIFKGGVNTTVVDIKVIFREAVLHLASGIILAHNHPSGNTSPSEADISTTRLLQKGAKLFDIVVLDHVIIAHNKYFSFADAGML